MLVHKPLDIMFVVVRQNLKLLFYFFKWCGLQFEMGQIKANYNIILQHNNMDNSEDIKIVLTYV